MMPVIPIDASLAPEVVEFWGKRYREVKEELEELKVRVLPSTIEDLAEHCCRRLAALRRIARRMASRGAHPPGWKAYSPSSTFTSPLYARKTSLRWSQRRTTDL